MQKLPIKDVAGRVWGWVQIEDDGNKKALDYTGKILGYYKAGSNTTYDVTGRIVAYGDLVSSLIKIGGRS